MIEIAKLKNMLKAEAAADDWWAGLSPKEKKAYLAAHPKSKYGKGASPTLAHLKSVMTHHSKEQERHRRLAGGAYEDGKRDKYRAHTQATSLHGRIANRYAKAIQAHKAGDTRRADIHTANAERLTHKLDQHKAVTGLTKAKSGKTAEPKINPKQPAGKVLKKEAAPEAKTEPTFDTLKNSDLGRHTRAAISAAGIKHVKSYGEAPMMAPHDFWKVHEFEHPTPAQKKSLRASLIGLGYEEKKPSQGMSLHFRHPTLRHAVYHLDDIGLVHSTPTEHGFQDS